MKSKLYSIWIEFLKCLFVIFRIFPVKKNKIIFSSFVGKGFGDNPKYIAIHLHKVSPEFKIYWIVKNKSNYDLPTWIIPIKLGSISMVYHMVTASFWIDNARKPIYVKKRKGQFYIQTWHGGIPGKRVEKDTVTPLPKKWVETSKNDSLMADMFVSNCKFATNHYKTAFWYNGEIIECGYPRNDIFFSHDEIKKNILEQLKIPENKKIVLYAPTFRNSEKNVYDINMTNVVLALEKKFGGEWVALVRLHPLMNKNQFNFNQSVIDCTDYPDMYELLRVADVEITDYSSSIFEFACLQKKPAFTYGKDVEEYRKERGFYYDVCELPFPFANSNDDIVKNILNFDQNDYNKKLEIFNNEIGWMEKGNASEFITNIIVERGK